MPLKKFWLLDVFCFYATSVSPCVERCIVGRAKMWSHQMLPEMFSAAFSSDSFFLNLGVLLLRLSSPFTASNSRLVLQVQPTYCLATVGDRTVARSRKVHMIGG
jgi:hypothetical protein